MAKETQQADLGIQPQPSLQDKLESIVKAYARAVASVTRQSADEVLPFAAEFAPKALAWEQQAPAASDPQRQQAAQRTLSALRQLMLLKATTLGVKLEQQQIMALWATFDTLTACIGAVLK